MKCPRCQGFATTMPEGGIGCVNCGWHSWKGDDGSYPTFPIAFETRPIERKHKRKDLSRRAGWVRLPLGRVV